jgi:hypothetical protein
MSSEEEPVAWLRKRINERLYLAQRTIELGNAAAWTELSTGVLVTGEPTETDAWHGTWPTGDSSLTRLMEANDPQDTIARCEAELAILDLYGKTTAIVCSSAGKPGFFAAREYLDGIRELCALKEVIRLLASGYKHRPGFPAAFAADGLHAG